MTERYALRWNGELVGYLEEPQFDMWWAYGRWVSVGNPKEGVLFALLPDSPEHPDNQEVEYNDQWVECQTGDDS